MAYDTDEAAKKRNNALAKFNKQDRADVLNAIRALSSHAQGRRFLLWLLEIGKAIGINAHTGHALNTSFNCGEQNVGQQVMLAIIESGEDVFINLLKDQANVRRERDAAVHRAIYGDDGDENSGRTGRDPGPEGSGDDRRNLRDEGFAV